MEIESAEAGNGVSGSFAILAWHSEHVDPGFDGGARGLDWCKHVLIPITLKGIQPRPVFWQVGRHEHLDLDRFSIGVEHKAWEAELRAPSSSNQTAAHGSLETSAFEPGQLLVGASRAQQLDLFADPA